MSVQSWFMIAVIGSSLTATAAPIASFTATPNPAAPGQSIVFNGSASYDTDPSRSIVAHFWDFADGWGANGQVDVHSYLLFGTYLVKLTVFNNINEFASTSLSIQVNQGNQAPTAVSGGPYVLTAGQPLNLNGAGSSDPNVPVGDFISTYDWDLNNDGSYDISGSNPAPSVSWSTLQTLYGFTPLSSHVIGLRVTDMFGLSDVDTANVEVLAASSVPEPATWALWMSGFAVIWVRLRRRTQ